MSQAIIDQNPQDNPRLNQIFQILLLAGYFRIRIASLKAFDKIVGGIAWCITSSNFQIEVQYNDEMQIGQKIKVSQIICESLMKMKCPYSLQPFQLQGLDVNNIFPIVQWLVKFVYETRFQRQKYDRELSMILGKPLTKLQNFGNPEQIQKKTIIRARVNRVIQKTNYSHPIRVYSALLQYNDASATKMYNKLLNTMTKKSKKTKGQQKGEKGKGDLIQILGEDNEDQNMKNESTMNQFGQFNSNQKLSLDKLQSIIQMNKNMIEQGIHQHDHQQQDELAKNYQKYQQNDNKNMQKQRNQLVNEKQKEVKQKKQENMKYQKKIQILRNQLESFLAISDSIDQEIQEIKKKHELAQQLARKQIQKNDQYRQAQKQIVQQLKANKSKINSKIEKLVQKRQILKNKKGQIKKKAKAKIDQLNYQYQLAQSSIPEIDEQAFKQMLEQAEKKKQIYDKKYEQLTIVNQQLAILQRKAQNFTSPPEIAQYHQRFVELFESINVLIQQKRSMFSQISNLQSLKKVAANYSQIMGNMKSGYNEVKKKSQLKEFNEDIKQILNGLQANMKNSQTTLSKIKGKRESVYGQCMDLIKLQRDYLHLLRLLKIQYQNAARLYK